MTTGKKIAAPFMISLALIVLGALGAGSASAASPHWHVTATAMPTNLAPGGEGKIVVLAENLGDEPVNAASVPVTILDKLPPGLEAVEAFGYTLSETFEEGQNPEHGRPGFLTCAAAAPTSYPSREVSCSFGGPGAGPELVEHTIAPYGDLEATIEVRVKPGASLGASEENEVTVQGGEAPSVKVKRPVNIGAQTAPFGVEEYELTPENEDGSLDTQAGSHPYQLTNTVTLNTKLEAGHPTPVSLPKDLRVALPPGLIGNTTAVPQCSTVEFFTIALNRDRCAANTAIGMASLTIDEPANFGQIRRENGELVNGLIAHTGEAPIFNLTPSQGEPARFGFVVLGKPVVLKTAVRSGGDYGVTVSAESITQLAAFLSSRLTFWGVPGESSHDSSRGWACMSQGDYLKLGEPAPACVRPEQAHPAPFLTLGTSCAGPLVTSIEGDSWAGPYKPSETFEPTLDKPATLPALDGCNELPFEPSIQASPDVPDASTSTGLTVSVRVPQEVNENGGALGSSGVRDITVALPPGVAVNPSGGNGLEACTGDPGALAAGRLGSPGDQIGYLGSSELSTQPGTSTLLFTPRLPGSFGTEGDGEDATLRPGSNFCPNASKVGTARIKLPVIGHPLEGAVYLASQNANPFGSLIAMYIVAEDPVSGVLIKLAGQVTLCADAGQVVDGMSCAAAGQVVTRFENSPDGPLESAELHYFGGERAPLATPSHCGAYTTTAVFTPWSGTPPIDSASTFDITSGPHGSPCPGASLPFNPSLSAQSTNIEAGGFTPLSTTIGRSDGEQDLARVTLHFPPGLSGSLANVQLCPEAQANAGTCAPQSLIGESTVSAGVGSDPVSVTGGKVYITEHYHGAPFGLSIVNPVKAGPFDLEHDTSGGPGAGNDPACDCLVVRGKLELDPHTAALTFTSNSENEGYAIPHLIDGIPVQIQKVNVTIDREHFTFNPTNCDPMKIGGSIESDEGMVMPVAVPFQVTNCANLEFKPSLKASTSGKTSRADGASLHVKLTYPKASFDTQAHIRSVKVSLPKQLPSRLSTLQKACTSVQFAVNPAGCPAESIVGHAVVHTQILPVPLQGPAYFVSHGGEEFPNLIIVLQGDGVTIDLVGDTFIEHGVTSSTFRSTPDVPFETFELELPQGKFSALAANTDLCRANLVMPNVFDAQNGAQIKHNTPIEVQGCPYSLGIIARRVHHQTLTLKVSVPGAGKLLASGRGVSKAVKTARGRSTLTLTLKEDHAGRLRTKVQLRLTPRGAAGKQRGKNAKVVRKSITVTFG